MNWLQALTTLDLHHAVLITVAQVAGSCPCEAERRLQRLALGSGIKGKQPAVIAASVAAQLLQVWDKAHN